MQAAGQSTGRVGGGWVRGLGKGAREGRQQAGGWTTGWGVIYSPGPSPL